MPEKEFFFRDFRGGLNTDALPGSLAANELAVCDNAIIGKRGGISKRGGFATKLNTAPLGGHAEQFIPWVREDGTLTKLGVKNIGGVYTLFTYNADGSTTDLQAINGLIGHSFYADRIYFVDGTQYWYYDGAAVGVTGMPAAPAAPTLTADGADGALTGSFMGKVVLVDKYGQESAASVASAATVAASSSHIDWTNIPVGGAGLNIVRRRLYRTKADGETYYFVADIDNNVDVAYVDTVTDEDLTTLLPTDLSLADVKTCTQMLWHGKSMRFMFVGDGSSAFRYGEPCGPAEVKAVSVLYPTMGMGEAVALAELNDAAIVFYERGMRYWAGIDPNLDANWDRMPTGYGLASPRALDMVTQGLALLTEGAILVLSPAIVGAPDEINPGTALVLDIAKDKIAELVQGIANPSVASMAFDATRKWILLARCASGTRNTDLLMADEGLGAWGRWTGVAANDITYAPDGTLVASIENYALQYDPETYHDIATDGTHQAIVFDMQTDEIDFGTYLQKTLDSLWICYQNPHRANYELQVRVYLDGVLYKDETLTPTLTKDRIWQKVKIGGQKFNSISVRLTNDQMDMPTTVHAIAMKPTFAPESGETER
jgi:hypothetical protein